MVGEVIGRRRRFNNIGYAKIVRQALNWNGTMTARSVVMKTYMEPGHYCLDTKLNTPVELLHWFTTGSLSRIKYWHVEALEGHRYTISENMLRLLTEMEVLAWVST